MSKKYTSDEELRKSTNEGDINNYNLIQQYKNDYKTAEAAGDIEGMNKANKNAEYVRAAYGYSGGNTGNNYTMLNQKNNNSFFGNAYEDVNKMQQQGFNAYKDMIGTQKQGIVDSINRGRNTINENYENAYKDLKTEENKTLEKLPEDMAKLGLYGSGTGETAYSKIKAGYAGELKKLLSDKNKALTDIDNQIADLENQSATQIAQYYADMMQKNPELYLNMLNNQANEFYTNRSYDRGVYESDRNFSFTANQHQDSKDEAEYNKKFNEAQISASYGNYQPLIDMGIITKEQADAYKASLMSSGGGKGRKTGGYEKELTKVDTKAETFEWLHSPWNLEKTDYFYKGWNDKTNPVYAARDKLNNSVAVREMKRDLVLAGYDADEADDIIEEFKETVAGEIKKMEGKE